MLFSEMIILIGFNVSYKQIGIEKMKVEWNQVNDKMNYNLSRFQVLNDTNQSIGYSDENSLEIRKFKLNWLGF